jgi:hypothetical protein
MYPEKELMLLGADKSALRLRISARRAETALLVARAVKPLEAFDQAIATIRAMLPLLGIAALPVGFARPRRRHRPPFASTQTERRTRRRFRRPDQGHGVKPQ